MRKLTYILSALRSPRKIIQSLSYVSNDGTFWDAYVRDWKKSEQRNVLRYLGNEWKNEEIFLSLLHRYSSPDRDALEIGCGGGRVSSEAVKHFRHVFASDVSEQMLRQCRRAVQAENISYHKLDGFTLDGFSDSSLDVVFSHDVFVHFSSLQVYPYFKEIKRVLRGGGLAIISFYNFVHHFGLFKALCLELNDQERIPPHMRIHFLTEEMIQLMIRDLDLDLVEVEKTEFLIVVFRKKPDSTS